MKKTALLLLLILCTTNTYSQLKTGERLVYSGSYYMGGILTPLAQITMSTSSITTTKKTYLHLSCEATTYSKWDTFFKIRDTYEAYVNPADFKPALYKRNISEGGFTKTEKYIFKTEARTVTSTSKRKNKPEKTTTFSIGADTQDVVTLIYRIRTIDFNNFQAGQSKTFTIVFDEIQIPVTLKHMGTETLSCGNLGSKNCYKLSIAASTNALKGKDKNIIYLTADNKKIPAVIKFSIPVGLGQLTLANASGL